MPADFLTLLRRDHIDLQEELTQLLDPGASVAELRTALDGVRLGLIAHAEAEDIVLGAYELVPELPALRAHVPADYFTRLAGKFATERLRQLAMLQPSAPMFMPELELATAS